MSSISNSAEPVKLKDIQEFQSAILRLVAWAVMVSFIGFAGLEGYYEVNWTLYFVLFGLHFVWFIGLVVHVYRYRDPSVKRQFVAMAADLSGTTFSIYLGGEAVSPFYLLYIWSFVSQGMRYGKLNLIWASIGSVVCYSAVVSVIGAWDEDGLAVGFLLFLLIVIPFYQYSLIRQLQEAKDAAVRANEVRGNFLATMTHELRTPLAGVIGMSGLLQTTKLDDEQRLYLDSIQSSAGFLKSLIGDILDLSKIDADRLEIHARNFDFRKTVVEVCWALSSDAQSKGLEVVCRIDEKVPQNVFGDDVRVRQVLFNLAGNAVKFTDHGHVVIRVKVDEDHPQVRKRHLWIEVEDTGIGIAEDKIKRIFEGFWQADATTTRKFGGTGLGTTIAQKLVHLMGGEIGLESTLGRGTTFWVRLPLLDKASAPPEPPEILHGKTAIVMESEPQSLAALIDACEQAQMHVLPVADMDALGRLRREGFADRIVDLAVVADSVKGQDLDGLTIMLEQLVDNEALPVLYLHYTNTIQQRSSERRRVIPKPFNTINYWDNLAGLIDPTRPHSQASSEDRILKSAHDVGRVSVLVAEDDNINALLIERLMIKSDHDVTLVRDGEAALEAAKKQRFDFALIDLRMPKMDGIEFTQAYRQLDNAKPLPIIALTANAREDASAECLAAGMDDFLTKPIDPERLNELIGRYGKQANQAASEEA